MWKREHYISTFKMKFYYDTCFNHHILYEVYEIRYHGNVLEKGF